MRFLIAFLSLFSLTVFAAAPQYKTKTDCVDVKEPIAWTYCKTETIGSRNRDLLYHFHGRGGKATFWTDKDYYTTLVRSEWARYGFHPPTVVSISFGPIWLLVEKNKSPDSGLLEVFQNVVMPTVEKSLKHFSGRRLLVGESMGGFNATQVALKTGNDFAKVAILCPPMVTLSPFSTKEEIEAYLSTHKANPQLVKEMIMLSHAFMPEEADWLKASPLELAKTKLNPRTPSLYLSCGFYDEFGFYPGSEIFAEMAVKQRARLQWRPLYGGHCAVDGISLAAFLR